MSLFAQAAGALVGIALQCVFWYLVAMVGKHILMFVGIL
jgi:hypothetical protein